MRKLIVRVFDYSLDGLIPEEDTEFYQFCRDLPDTPASDAFSEEFEAGADVHIMGRVHYLQMAAAFSDNFEDPFAEMLTAARKVVFSRTLKTAGWANTAIVDGDLAEEVDKLRHGGDGYILASGGVSFWRSLARLDLVDEYRVIMVPYLAAGGGKRLFDDADESRRLELLSSTAFDNGMVGLRYRRRR
jgi:dihydrofolate reductase